MCRKKTGIMFIGEELTEFLYQMLRKDQLRRRRISSVSILMIIIKELRYFKINIQSELAISIHIHQLFLSY